MESTEYKEFFLIWNPIGRSPTYKHESIVTATKEAERLAVQNPGHEFHVLRAIGACTKRDVIWSRPLLNKPQPDDDIPF